MAMLNVWIAQALPSLSRKPWRNDRFAPLGCEPVGERPLWDHRIGLPVREPLTTQRGTLK
jgi:hypothetical protein